MGQRCFPLWWRINWPNGGRKTRKCSKETWMRSLWGDMETPRRTSERCAYSFPAMTQNMSPGIRSLSRAAWGWSRDVFWPALCAFAFYNVWQQHDLPGVLPPFDGVDQDSCRFGCHFRHLVIQWGETGAA